MIIQPHKFEVTAHESQAETIAVQEAVDELLETAKKDANDGTIQFDMLITLEGDESTVSYSVAPGDTLSEIAKLFGTTSSAIAQANNIAVGQVLRVGQKLKIAYDKSIIYDVKETIEVDTFSEKYDIPLEELMTLNYFDSEESVIEEGQQLFIPLNRVEAQDRGLIRKKEFIKLDLPRKIIEDELLAQEEGKQILSGIQQDLVPAPAGEPSQVVITAEDTKRHLEALDQAKKQAVIAEAKAKELAEIAEKARVKAEEEAKTARTEEARLAKIEAEKRAEEARLAKVESESKAAILAKAEAEDQERRKAQQEEENKKLQKSCSASQCYHDGNCRAKPENALCAPTDPHNARTCTVGFVDTGRTCITKAEHKKRTAQATTPKKKAGVLKQRYFNPYNDGYGGNGWAGGHCTMYVGRWIWKNLGKHTQRRGNAKYWYDNASAAGRRVGQTPQIGSVIVMKYGSQGWNGYGHVGMVIDIDWGSRQVLIEDMNYVGRYVVSQHRADMDSSVNPVIGYIYP